MGFAGTIMTALPGICRPARIAAAGAGRRADPGRPALAYGIAINLARPLQQRNGALPVIWRSLGVALLLTAPLGLPALSRARWSSALAPWPCSLLGAFGTAIAHVMAATAAGRLGATRAAATTFLMPVVALVLGVAIRDEVVQPLSVVGAAVCPRRRVDHPLRRPSRRENRAGAGANATGADRRGQACFPFLRSAIPATTSNPADARRRRRFAQHEVL